MEIVFATNNTHKLKEIRNILGGQYRVYGLEEKNIVEEIPEDFLTLKENALQKARFVRDKYHLDCFADDTGLEVVALHNEPGVFSARYSRMDPIVNVHHDTTADNIQKLLNNLTGVADRSACFRTVVALVLDDKEYFFEGRVDGRIIDQPRGTLGFGYDPVFVPDGSDQTFAEMELQEKNRISHRAIAVQSLASFLKEYSRSGQNNIDEKNTY